VQHLGPEGRHLQHLLIADPRQPPSPGLDARIGGVDTVDIGVDVASFGAERRGVARRPDRVTPWKPAITATSPVSIAAPSFSAGISSMRARPWASSVRMGICQPIQDRAGTPMLRKVMASRPAVTCSPDATTVSYSSSLSGRSPAEAPAPSVQATSSLVLPAMAETTTATGRADASAATSRATRRMRSRSATDVPPNFITSRDTMGLYRRGSGY
jgi:hypothetical protein